MKIFQPLCVAVLALSAYAGNVAASAPAVSDDSLAFNNMTGYPTWETPDLPYARLLTQHSTLNATPRWLNAGTRQSALAPPPPPPGLPYNSRTCRRPYPKRAWSRCCWWDWVCWP